MQFQKFRRLIPLTALALCSAVWAADEPLSRQLDARVAAISDQLIAWRRDIHLHPELSGKEQRTAALVAAHLKKLGFEVKTGIAGTGVMGILKGGKPGKTIALRADMDALPVKEMTGLAFASAARSTHMGKDVDVMHACGHDGHTAILMAVAEVLAGMKEQIPGTVKFIFQPSEEGISDPLPTPQSSYGARAMVQAGVLDGVDAIFGLHVSSGLPTGVIGYRSGPLLASADSFKIRVTGRQTHGAMPWLGVDPITVSSQVVLALQTIVSRQIDITKEPAVVTVGAFNGGNRENIIPDYVDMLGTVRTFDDGMRDDIIKRVRQTAESIAAAAGAKAEVSFGDVGYSATVNDDKLTQRMVPTLARVSDGNIMVIPKVSGSEDFSEYQKKVPGLFFILGVTSKEKNPRTAAPNHSPLFTIDEAALPLGVRGLAALTLDYLAQQ